MSAPPLSRLAPLLLPVLGAVLVLAAVEAFPRDGGSWLRLLAYVAVAAAAALYRPAGIGLGPGAAALPLARATLGWGGATILAVAATAAVGFVPAVAPPGERRSPRSRTRRALDDAAMHATAAAGAAATWGLGRTPLARAVLASVAWLALLALLPLVQRRLAQMSLPPAWWKPLDGLLADALGWTMGVALLFVLARAGEAATGVLLVTWTVLAVETGRQRRARQQAESGRAALEEVGRAGERLLASSSAAAEVAGRILQECRGVLPVSWFHLEITAAASAGGSWHAGPDGRLREGWPRVPVHPPPLPGVHRRGSWQLLERVLVSGSAELARLTLWCDPRRLSEGVPRQPDAMALFDQLVPQLAGHVHRAILATQAHQDPLTGAALRRVLDIRLAAALETSRETGSPVSVVLLDLDFFKRVNDKFGHAAGDRALVAVAGVLLAGVRENDLCARYGGEEFTLLLEGLAGEAALAIVERLRAQVEALEVVHEGTRLPLSVSAGIAAYPEVPSRTPEELLQVADGALYEAKRLGRNCCLLHIGRGRFVDGQGRRIETDEAGAGTKAPQIFA